MPPRCFPPFGGGWATASVCVCALAARCFCFGAAEITSRNTRPAGACNARGRRSRGYSIGRSQWNRNGRRMAVLLRANAYLTQMYALMPSVVSIRSCGGSLSLE
ncbi:hypothetical protein OH77DRAFT_1426100 [Trametes cingulata]|nr:hypothetical protein OH77DRAFT_1426100 [Trametes cingulata]